MTKKTGTGKWIKGLGSEFGFMENIGFGHDGRTSVLESIEDVNGIILYKRASASEAEVSVNPDFYLNINGYDITLSSNHDNPIHIFSSAGLLIKNFMATKTPATISLPDQGIYILKSNGCFRKILIR